MMRNLRKVSNNFALFIAPWILAGAGGAQAADPGLLIPPASEASDQKLGSVLFYNLYTSSAASPSTEDTRISITNHSDDSASFMRLFFINGQSGTAAHRTVCLTAQQTVSFNASDLRPGETGYLVAVPIDGVQGCPTSFNYMSGQAELKLEGGERGTLGAVAFAAQYAGNFPGCDANSVTSVLGFNGVDNAGYNRAPRVLQVPQLASATDGNTLLIVNRVGGNMTTTAGVIGFLNGALFDDQENLFGFVANAQTPQLVQDVSDAFPVTAPPFTDVIPAGRKGWMKFWSPNDIGLLGSQLTLAKTTTEKRKGKTVTTTTTTSPSGGVNLRAVTTTASPTLTIPVASPSC